MALIAGKYMTMADVKDYLCIGKDGIYTLIRKGYLTPFIDKNRRNLFEKTQIDEYLDSCKQSINI